MMSSKTYKFYLLTIVLLVLLGIFRILNFTRKINDHIIHDQGILLSVAISPVEAILSGKGLTYPSTGYGSILSAYLVYPATFFPIDLLTFWIFLNLFFRVLVFYLLGLFLLLNKKFFLGFFSFLVPVIIPSETVFTWGYYAFAEIEFIVITLIIYLLINKKYEYLIFFILGLFLAIDLRGLPLTLPFFFTYVFILNNSKKHGIKLIFSFLIGALAAMIYTSIFIKKSNALDSNQFPSVIQEYERLNVGFDVFRDYLGNSIFIFIILFIFLQLIKISSDYSLKRFVLILVLSATLIFPLMGLMVNSRVLESYSYFNANRIFLYTLPAIIIYFYFLDIIKFQKKYILDKISTLFLLIFLVVQFNLTQFQPPNQIDVSGPSPAFDRIKLRENCKEFYLNEEERATDNYLLTHQWELAYTCEVLLSPSRHARLVNTNPFAGGELRPWRREKIPS